MSNTIKTGILTFGFSSRIFHAPFIHAHPRFTLSAVVERHEKKARAIYPETTSYDSINDLLNDPEIELVIINTPNNLHYEHGKLALSRGKHVLMEKPFCANVSQARELFKMAADKGLHILPYHNRRWDSDFLSVRNVIRSGKLGKLIEVHFRFDRYNQALSPKKFKEINQEGSGVSYDLGSHLLDQVISLFGPPLSYDKAYGFNRPETQVDDYFSVRMTYPDNLYVTITSNLLAADPQPAFIIHGMNGTYTKERSDIQETQLINAIPPTTTDYGIESESKKGKLTLAQTNGQLNSEFIKAPKGNYMGLFDAVYSTLRENSTYPITSDNILKQLDNYHEITIVCRYAI